VLQHHRTNIYFLGSFLEDLDTISLIDVYECRTQAAIQLIHICITKLTLRDKHETRSIQIIRI